MLLRSRLRLQDINNLQTSLQETIADKEEATASASQPRKRTHMCMSSIDHSHIGDVTDVHWLSSVAFSREGAARTEVWVAHSSLNA